MAGNRGNGRSKQDLLDEIDDLQQQNQDLQDQLDAIADIVSPEEELFSAAEFCQLMQAYNFMGAVAFWRQSERLARPEKRTCLHAMRLLCELARRAFEDCQGLAFSPQQAERFEYCGLTPIGIRSPGSAGRTLK
jgi:hypothetical protein